MLFLASASPRRHEILNQLGLSHRVLEVPKTAGEDEPQFPDERAADYVVRIAREKALQGASWLAHKDAAPDVLLPKQAYWILAADTTVILNNEVLGKPQDNAMAANMLARLSGQRHEVRTAVALYHQGQLFEAVSISEVVFKGLSKEEIDCYIDSEEHQGKAGAYGIQGRAAAFIAHLSGSYTGVMGLPAYETIELLRQARYPSLL